jgi:3-methyladenine DNA glycosylase Tag
MPVIIHHRRRQPLGPLASGAAIVLILDLARGSGRMEPASFDEIHEAALVRHGTPAIEARLVLPRTAAELTTLGDDRYLSLMSLRTFRAGLRHSVVDARWPAFEEVFWGFAPERCAAISDERIEELLTDRRLIRHLGKLRAVRANAASIVALRAAGQPIGAWLAAWPAGDIVGLWDELARRFSQLGGNSGAYFLRMAGKDTFILSTSVAKALTHWRAMPAPPTSRADRRVVQGVFTRWALESGRPLCQLSQILAMSVD